MRGNRRRIATLLYRAGSPYDLDRIEIAEAVQSAGFQLLEPPICAESELAQLMCDDRREVVSTGGNLLSSLQRAGFNPFRYLNAMPNIDDRVRLFGVDVVAPAIVAPMGPAAVRRMVDFFVQRLDNRHTRRAYATAVGEFIRWCGHQGFESFADVQARDISHYYQHLTSNKSGATAGQRLSAIRHMYDWLALDNAVWANPVPSRLQAMAMAS